MTKGADGTTRVISQPIGATKSILASEATKSHSTPHKEGPQKVQIIRAPDGKITVRGLLAGQQLIQMPDGKLHVVMPGQQGIAGQLVAASPVPKTDANSVSNDTTDKVGGENKSNTVNTGVAQTPRIASQASTPSALPAGRHIVVQPAQQVVVQAGAPAVLLPGALLPRAAPAPRAAPPRPRAPAQQIVVSNPALVQQIAAGKIQLATVNGQQVLIRPTGNNQAQIVAHIGQSPSVAPAAVSVAAPSPAPAPAPAPASAPAVRPLAALPATETQSQLTEDQMMEKRLLAGQPPGTVIKTVTAQVIIVDGFVNWRRTLRIYRSTHIVRFVKGHADEQRPEHRPPGPARLLADAAAAGARPASSEAATPKR